MIRAAACALLLVAACAVPQWQGDLLSALSAARSARQDLVVHFALPSEEGGALARENLDAAEVTAALGRNGFAAVVCDATANARLYAKWVGYGVGHGIAVLDGAGEVYAARPGRQDPGELVALLDLCASLRPELRAARARLFEAPADPATKLDLGRLHLRLGHLRAAEPLLLDAALSGLAAHRHWVARLYAHLGQLRPANRWLRHAPPTPAAEFTRGLVLFTERRYEEALEAIGGALRSGELGEDRQSGLLLVGHCLHEVGQDDRALPLLRKLASEGEGSIAEAAAASAVRRFTSAGRWAGR